MPLGQPTASPANVAKTLFVDAANGSANGVRGRAEKPFQTITQAKTAAQRGDLIWVRPGLYAEIDLLKSFSATVTSAERSGYILTVNSTAHGFVAGDLVYFPSFADTTFNGEFIVSTASANSFTVAQWQEDASETSGLALGVLNYWFDPGAVIEFSHPDGTPAGGMFDDSTATGACWNYVKGHGTFRFTNWITSSSATQAAVRITSAHSRIEIEGRSLDVFDEPAVYVNSTTATLALRIASQIANVYGNTPLIVLMACANATLEADRINGLGICVRASHSGIAHVRARELNGFGGDTTGVNFSGGTGTTYVFANRMIGGIDATPNVKGFVDAEEIIGRIDCSGDGATFVEVRNARIDGTALVVAPVTLTVTSGLTLRNVKLVAASGVTNSITCTVAETVKIMNVFANKAVGAGVTQQIGTVTVSTDVN